MTDEKNNKWLPTFGKIKWNRFKWLGVILSILIALAWWNLYRGKPLRISPETTVYTEPLTPDGKHVDYFKVMESKYPPQMKTDKNAARGIIKAVGTKGEMSESFKPDAPKWSVQKRELRVRFIYDRLGLDYDRSVPQFGLETSPVGMSPGFYEKRIERKYPGPANKSKCEAEMARFKRFADNNRYALFDMDYTRDWVVKNTAGLDAVVDAIFAADVCSWPAIPPDLDDASVLPVYEVMLPCLQTSREYGRALESRATWYADRGEFDKAVRDKIACGRLGSMTSANAVFIVDDLVGIALCGISCGIPLVYDVEKRPSRETWQRLMDEAKISSSPEQIQKVLQLERLGGLSVISCLDAAPRRQEREKFLPLCDLWLPHQTGYSQFLMKSLLFMGFDWNYVAKKYNEEYDRYLSDPVSQEANGYNDPAKLFFHEKSDFQVLWNFARSCTTLRSRSDLLAKVQVGLFTPAQGAYLEADARKDCMGNLQKIDVAMQLYLCEHGTLPPTFTVDKTGKPLHSWRVLILPYLGKEEKELYRNIRLNEPWNSEFNRQFHARMPQIYQCRSMAQTLRESQNEETAGKTGYTVLVGPDTLFNSSGKGVDPLRLHREKPEKEVSRMVLVAERLDPVCWMTPDAERTQQEAMLPLGRNIKSAGLPKNLCSTHPGGFNAARLDGSVTFIAATLKESARKRHFLGEAEQE